MFGSRVQFPVDTNWSFRLYLFLHDLKFASFSSKTSGSSCCCSAALLPVARCPSSSKKTFQGFYSNLFTVPKTILNLRIQNFLCGFKSSWKLHGTSQAGDYCLQGDFLALVDIQDAYLHIPIACAVSGQHYQFVYLPYGLSTAPQGFNYSKDLQTFGWILNNMEVKSGT